MESGWNGKAGGLGRTHGLEMPCKGWSERLSIQPATCWGRNLGWNLGSCTDKSDANSNHVLLRPLPRCLATSAGHSTALCGLCVSLFPSAENNSIIKAVKCIREGAVVFPEGADMEEGIQRSLLHAHKALGTLCACPRRARARQEMRHSIHRDPMAQGKGKQRRNKE